MVQNSKSKKAGKQAVKAPPVSNGCDESESQNVKGTPSKVESEMDVDTVVETNVNSRQDNGVEPGTSSEGVRQPVKSQKKKAADAVEVENSENNGEKGDEKSTVSVSKTKGRQRKGKDTKMETTENTANEPQASGESQTEVSAEPVQQSSIPDEEEAVADVQIENVTEPEPQIEEASTSKRKMRKRKAATPIATERTSKRSAKEKPKKIVTKTKAKKKEVLLTIPSIESISGKVLVVGENDVGQLGFGEEVEMKTRPAVLELPYSISDIAAGGMHSVCLTQSGEVITFGCNDEGALGRETADESDEATPHKVDISEKVVQVSAGDSHTAALTESGQVYIWGNFRNGDGAMGLTAEGFKQIKPVKILNGITIVKISSGTEHLACLSNVGIVYTCGCGENGQLGRFREGACRDGGRKGRAALLEPDKVPVTGHPASKTVLIEDVWTGSYTTFLKAQDTGLIYAFGLNNYNHLGFENERIRFFPKQVSSFNDNSWKQITGGQHHTLALDSEGLVYAMGRRDYGRLGLGEDCEEKSTPTFITFLENEKCSNISCGNVVSFAVTEEGSMYSWGMGTNHQLGHGNDEDCHIPRLVEGNLLRSWKTHKVSGGGLHALILATAKESAEKDAKK